MKKALWIIAVTALTGALSACGGGGGGGSSASGSTPPDPVVTNPNIKVQGNYTAKETGVSTTLQGMTLAIGLTPGGSAFGADSDCSAYVGQSSYDGKTLTVTGTAYRPAVCNGTTVTASPTWPSGKASASFTMTGSLQPDGTLQLTYVGPQGTKSLLAVLDTESTRSTTLANLAGGSFKDSLGNTFTVDTSGKVTGAMKDGSAVAGTLVSMNAGAASQSTTTVGALNQFQATLTVNGTSVQGLAELTDANGSSNNALSVILYSPLSNSTLVSQFVRTN
ncbi:hypothetical protein F6X40_17225 [Paraburkholderia sp. UCT31]|uniref:hypothetical protein n=1 Tax=Paraburkholderia sp. UCT31 TaxID=2615209 RepID=UPI001655F7F2|nr:hypothetical protein [Paraburkholderia sp. UCT31]MBC8738517.1 hypothetical protein [Paraburkholderia sp. UCT31]